jgi:hypothetical protein
MSSPPKPWSVATFERLRPHLTGFVRETLLPLIEEGCRRIVLRAPVKCGKREIVEYIATRDLINQPSRIHAFLSAWHRIADEDQRDELATHNMTVFSITTQKRVDSFMAWLKKQLDKGLSVVLHLDECDHGTGSKQMLSKVWTEIRDSDSITNILYSATPEEVLYSGEVDDEEYQAMMEEISEGEHVEYTPPEGYCGPARFLREGLVREAIPFFDKDGLTCQGKEIVAGLRSSMVANPSRNMIVLRLSYSLGGGVKKDIKKNKAIYRFLSSVNGFPELEDFLVVVDKSDSSGIKNKRVSAEKIQWSDPSYWRRQASGVPIVIVIDQTCSRSTEWACHDRIYATHDFRNIVQYSTVSQAQERVNHYEQRYGGFQPILVYGHRRTFRMSAGLIDYATFLKDEWKKKKIDVRSSPEERYRVLSTVTNERHPSCPEEGMKEGDADHLLQELGCYADISLSARIAGSVREVRSYTGTWAAVTRETWDTFRMGQEELVARARNPFDAAERRCLPDGTWMGQHRGWKVLECVGNDLYQRVDGELKKLDLGSTGGNRIKICYKGGELGVFIARCTGTRTMDTLRAFNSMYG